MDDPAKREEDIRRDERRRIAGAMRSGLAEAEEARNPAVKKVIVELIEVLER